ncbi:MAG: hypothetical protein H6R19_1622 [Proteobacteria bacterium]|nr:hypothetical protein [Pseudomonadota bacterium]
MTNRSRHDADFCRFLYTLVSAQMSPDEVTQLLSYFGTLGLGFVLGTGVVFLLLKFFIPNYLAKKAENLATKEDIGAITSIVAKVNSKYSELLENLKVQHQLRLAAIDKRLQAHQEAFTKWRKLYGAIYSPDIMNVVIECQIWWDENCLYLEPEIRRAFADAFSAASMHESYITGGDDVVIKNNWKTITDFPNLLFLAVQLPKLTSTESRVIYGNKTGDRHRANNSSINQS